MTRPAMYFPPGYDDARALECARLVRVAYDMCFAWIGQGRPRRESGFHWRADAGAGYHCSAPVWSAERVLLVLDEAEPFVLAARAPDGTGYLVFRGTETRHDWIDDAHEDQRPYPYARGFGAVHHGFLRLFASMTGGLERALDDAGPVSRWVVTGHSLGSALATLALPWLAAAGRPLASCHYNFASPRVGDPVFASAYHALGGTTFRVVNTSDIVPQIPLPVVGRTLYEHVGTPIDFTANYGSVPANHSMVNAYAWALTHPTAPFAESGGGGTGGGIEIAAPM